MPFPGLCRTENKNTPTASSEEAPVLGLDEVQLEGAAGSSRSACGRSSGSTAT